MRIFGFKIDSLTKSSKLITALFFTILYCFFTLFAKNLVIDDAYITFQYAKNFAEFGKPWYNLDPYFQGNGQTSIGWMAVLALMHLIGLKQELFFISLNIGLGSYLIIELSYFLELKTKKIIISLFNFFLISFFTYWLYLNSLHGLETVLACFVLYLFFKNWDKNKNYFVLFLPLIRPEFLLFQAFWILDTKIFSSDFYKRILFVCISVIFLSLYYYLFFDFYIPLPFLFKSQFTNYTLQKIFVYFGLLIIFLPIMSTLLFKRKFLLLIPLNILIFYYIFNVASYSSGIFQRYYFPLMAIFLVVPVKFPNFHFYNKLINYCFKILLIIAVLRMLDLSNNFYKQKTSISFENIGYFNSYKSLINLLKPSDKVSVNDAGFTAYYSKSTCYDGIGLNDAKLLIAIKNSDSAAYRSYFELKEINYVSIGSVQPYKFVARSESENFIFKSLNLKKQHPFKIFPMDTGYYLYIYKFENGYHD